MNYVNGVVIRSPLVNVAFLSLLNNHLIPRVAPTAVLYYVQ